MRNLKRVLALALALVMILGMMVIGSSAASYTDAAAIDEDYAVAVDVLTGMGVFKGTGAGFAPKALLSRAEAATLIYRVISADVKDAKIDLYNYSSFDDVAEGEWYTGYVTYAANGGYILGYDGNFMPTDKVTGIQVLAIMLRAMGYGQKGEFEGAGWKDGVLTVADDLKLLENVNVKSLDVPASRELVAQLLWDAINAPTTTYTPAFGYYPTTGVSLGVKNFGLAKATTRDEWGRPYYGWTYKTGAKATLYVEPHTTYTVAVSDCDIAKDMGLKKSATVNFYDNGVLTDTYINVTSQPADNGGQGVQIEVYENEIVRIDTYLARVDKVTKMVTDRNGHVVIPASTNLTVYKFNDTGIDPVMAGADYTVGDMILVNINEATDWVANTNVEDNVVYDLQIADAFVGAQTSHFFYSDKHEINGVQYNDAEHFYLDPAGVQAGDWTWYLDQFGNLIGDSKIVSPKAYAVLKSLQWINPEDANGYAKAVLVDMNGDTSVVELAAIDGATVKYVLGEAGVSGKTAYVSDDLADNFAVYCGKHLYEVTKTGTTVSLKAVAELDGAKIWKGQPDVKGKTGTILTDNATKYLIRVDTVVKGDVVAHSYETVTGYTNVNSYGKNYNCTVDYVDLDGDTIADYVYVIGQPNNSNSYALVYITAQANVQGALKKIGGYDYYVIPGVIRGDLSTDPLYVSADNVTLTEMKTWLAASVGKLFDVKAVNGYVEKLSDLKEVSYEYITTDKKIAKYAGAVTVIGDGMITTNCSDVNAFNTNEATVYVNQFGVMAESQLKVGDLVYVIAYTTSSTYQYDLDVVFVTSYDKAAEALAAAQAAAIAQLKADVASYVEWGYCTEAQLTETLDNAIAAVTACTTEAAVADAQSAGQNAIYAAAAAAKAEADKAAADFANLPTTGTTLKCVSTAENMTWGNLYIEVRNFKFEESLKIVLYTAEGKEIGSVSAVPNSASTLLTGRDIAITSAPWYLAGADENETHWVQTGSADYLNIPAYATLFIDGKAEESIKVGHDTNSGVDAMTEAFWFGWLDKAL